jgi:hypothetical protein
MSPCAPNGRRKKSLLCRGHHPKTLERDLSIGLVTIKLIVLKFLGTALNGYVNK